EGGGWWAGCGGPPPPPPPPRSKWWAMRMGVHDDEPGAALDPPPHCRGHDRRRAPGRRGRWMGSDDATRGRGDLAGASGGRLQCQEGSAPDWRGRGGGGGAWRGTGDGRGEAGGGGGGAEGGRGVPPARRLTTRRWG